MRRTRFDTRGGPSRGVLTARGLAATVVAVVVGGLLVAHGGGAFDRSPSVYADVPAEAGLVTGNPSVRYHGVSIGSVTQIDTGTESSRITLRLAADQMPRVPRTVLVRLAPRTLFGDVYVDLVELEGGANREGLRSGDVLRVDTSAEAVQLYSLYSEVSALIGRLEPQKAQQALTALSDALRGRGDDIGRMVDQSVHLTEVLSPLVDSALASTGQVARLADNLAAATPDALAGIDAATRISRTMLDHRAGLESILTASVGLTDTGNIFLQDNRERIVTVVDSGGSVLGTVADGRDGLARTLEGLDDFGAAGARIFQTGKFSITAVPSFADPMPYTASECPRYPGMDGANCGSPVTGGSEAERQALSVVEQAATGANPATDHANPAAGLLLGPLLRGTEVTVGE
ncbi:MCE family protein [Rhodococcus sp. NPDC058521]|uniref:MCE family protein n=1 Tax=Rhodococcus sp. NPDC058521 TaxID=3346536 RepID=UPI0036521E1D